MLMTELFTQVYTKFRMSQRTSPVIIQLLIPCFKKYTHTHTKTKKLPIWNEDLL